MNDVLSKVGSRVGDTSDLPEELRNELQSTKQGKLDVMIVNLIEVKYSGAANIDEILVGLFREHQQLLKRPFLANKLSRMAKANLIYTVPGKKGVYSTDKIYAII